MEAIFLKLVEQLNSSVFVLLACLLIIVWIVYKAGNISANFGEIKNKNKKFDDDIDTIKTDVASIRATTQLLYQSYLSTVKSQSPLSLTEKGDKISNELSLDQLVDEHWDSIYEQFTKNPLITNPYDIQTHSLAIAQDCFEKIFTDNEKNKIKTYAYEIGINLLEIIPIIGVEIRDRVLKLRGFNLKEIDKHDPRKNNFKN